MNLVLSTEVDKFTGFLPLLGPLFLTFYDPSHLCYNRGLRQPVNRVSLDIFHSSDCPRHLYLSPIKLPMILTFPSGHDITGPCHQAYKPPTALQGF